MSDRFPGEITIGGKLPAALLDEFLGEVASTGASVGGYDGPAFDCKNADDLRQALDTDRHLVLADAEASYGQFEELEAFCVKHGLPFDRHSDAKYEFDSVNVRFRPGMKRPVEVPSDNCGENLTDADKLRPVAKALARLATATLTKAKLLAAVRKASRKLDSLLPPEVESLPPLEVT
jgi:hypothetical protein